MEQLKAYQRKSLTAGWSRVELLLMLYDRAIASLQSCEIALQANDGTAFQRHELSFRKTLIAIQIGLKPEESEVAFNILRLLHFVLASFDERRFADCQTILEQVRDGFAQVAEQANELERSGSIPPLPTSDSFESLA